MTDEKLIDTAKKYRENAYAPYSKFKVGAAVLTSSGKIFGGCVEQSIFKPFRHAVNFSKLVDSRS